jgi:hypothetical protein
MTENKKYIPPKEEIKPELKGTLRETDTRMIIDRKLREAGWDIENKNHVVTEEPTKTGRVDYLLKNRRGRPLGIIEAKRFSIEPEAAKQQALEYALSANAYNPNIGQEEIRHREPRKILEEIWKVEKDLTKQINKIRDFIK